jgi:hypothetical protein
MAGPALLQMEIMRRAMLEIGEVLAVEIFNAERYPRG